MKKNTKNIQITLQERIAEIKKTQTGIRKDIIIPAPADEIITEWVTLMTEYCEVTAMCDKEFKARQSAYEAAMRNEKEIQCMNTEEYEQLHAKQIALKDKVADYRSEILEKTGFFLKWAM